MSSMLEKKIEKNRFRHSRFKKYGKVLNRIRLKMFEYQDMGKEDKANRIMKKCEKILAPLWKALKSNGVRI